VAVVPLSAELPALSWGARRHRHHCAYDLRCPVICRTKKSAAKWAAGTGGVPFATTRLPPREAKDVTAKLGLLRLRTQSSY
jgi:hypothetical protein